jgi:organic radical activating enzyme
MLSCLSVSEKLAMERMVLSGGEPLMHPDFEWMVETLRKEIPNAYVLVSTNGRLLDKYQHLKGRKVIFKISVYPGWNDEIVKKYKGQVGIKLERYKTFINAKADVNFTESEVQRIYRDCQRKRIMIVGRKVYPCCTSEVTERCHGLSKPVHVEMTPHWKQDILDMDFSEACRYCWRMKADLDKRIWNKGHE